MISVTPIVSVLMPVYNGEKYLREAINSILNQTFTDFEFLIINDGSTDNSKEIILSFDDHRIRYIENKKNIKLIGALNNGIQLAKGKYIARMDCDDISHPNRLTEQVDFMDNNPEIAVCGTYLETIGTDRKLFWKTPINHYEIICEMLFYSPINHPTVIFRKDILGQYLIYNDEYLHAEDYELWFRLSQYFTLANIPKMLYKYRVHNEQVTKKYHQTKIETANKVRRSVLLKVMPDATEEEINFHLNLVSNLYHKSDINLNYILRWFEELYNRNNAVMYFEKKTFRKVLTEKWAEICIYKRKFGHLIKSLFEKNSLSGIHILSSILKIVFRYIAK